MGRLSYLPASVDHIPDIAARMRQADIDEVWAAASHTPEEALRFSLEKSPFAVTALFDDRPEIMFGVGDLCILTLTGAPWLLGTRAVEQEFRVFLRHSKHWREQLLRRYETLRNVVDDRNEVSKRWLRWLGFTMSDPAPIGVNGEMFRLFEMRR